MELETVKIVCERQSSGYVIINKSDFDPKIHELYGVEKKPDKPDEPKRTYTRKT